MTKLSSSDLLQKTVFRSFWSEIDRLIVSFSNNHGWKCDVIMSDEEDHYVIMRITRFNFEKKIGIINSIHKTEDIFNKIIPMVDILFFNGPDQPEYTIDGIGIPFMSMYNYPSLLKKWNEESFLLKPHKIPKQNSIPGNGKHERILLSETPTDSIWLRLRQFHSTTLARKMLNEKLSRDGTILTSDDVQSKADGISYAIRNAYDYYQSSQSRNLNQKILNLYYGTMALCFAEILSSPNGPTKLSEIEDVTKQGHGLYTLDNNTNRAEDLVVGVISNGFFPLWAKSMGSNVINFPKKKPKSEKYLANCANTWTTITKLFSSIPEIGDIFSDIFDEKHSWVIVRNDSEANFPASFSQIYKKDIQKSYIRLIDPYCRLSEDDISEFSAPIGEINEIGAKDDGRHFRVAVDHCGHPEPWDVLQTHSSPFIELTIIKPILDNIDKYRAYCYIILYALSIMVRYRPGIWRRIQEGDLDHMRAMIEAFLSVAERMLPSIFLEIITGQIIYTKQPFRP